MLWGPFSNIESTRKSSIYRGSDKDMVLVHVYNWPEFLFIYKCA